MQLWSALARAVWGMARQFLTDELRVGILLAALYLTIWTQTVHAPSDFGVVLVAFALLTVWKRTPWQVVILGAIAGAALGLLPNSV